MTFTYFFTPKSFAGHLNERLGFTLNNRLLKNVKQEK